MAIKIGTSGFSFKDWKGTVYPKKTYVFFNNCHAGLAVKNACRLRDMLGIPSAAPQKQLAF